MWCIVLLNCLVLKYLAHSCRSLLPYELCHLHAGLVPCLVSPPPPCSHDQLTLFTRQQSAGSAAHTGLSRRSALYSDAQWACHTIPRSQLPAEPSPATAAAAASPVLVACSGILMRCFAIHPVSMSMSAAPQDLRAYSSQALTPLFAARIFGGSQSDYIPVLPTECVVVILTSSTAGLVQWTAVRISQPALIGRAASQAVAIISSGELLDLGEPVVEVLCGQDGNALLVFGLHGKVIGTGLPADPSAPSTIKSVSASSASASSATTAMNSSASSMICPEPALHPPEVRTWHLVRQAQAELLRLPASGGQGRLTVSSVCSYGDVVLCLIGDMLVSWQPYSDRTTSSTGSTAQSTSTTVNSIFAQSPVMRNAVLTVPSLHPQHRSSVTATASGTTRAPRARVLDFTLAEYNASVQAPPSEPNVPHARAQDGGYLPPRLRLMCRLAARSTWCTAELLLLLPSASNANAALTVQQPSHSQLLQRYMQSMAQVRLPALKCIQCHRDHLCSRCIPF